MTMTMTMAKVTMASRIQMGGSVTVLSGAVGGWCRQQQSVRRCVCRAERRALGSVGWACAAGISAEDPPPSWRERGACWSGTRRWSVWLAAVASHFAAYSSGAISCRVAVPTETRTMVAMPTQDGGGGSPGLAPGLRKEASSETKKDLVVRRQSRKRPEQPGRARAQEEVDAGREAEELGQRECRPGQIQVPSGAVARDGTRADPGCAQVHFIGYVFARVRSAFSPTIPNWRSRPC